MFREYLGEPDRERKTTLKVASTEVFEAFGLHPDTSNTFAFHVDFAPNWLSLIRSCIFPLRELLNVSESQQGKPNYSRDTLIEVDQRLRFLSLILRLPALEWLFTKSSLRFSFTLKDLSGKSPSLSQPIILETHLIISRKDAAVIDDGEFCYDDPFETSHANIYARR